MLEPAIADFFRRQGNGNLSAGIQKVAVRAILDELNGPGRLTGIKQANPKAPKRSVCGLLLGGIYTRRSCRGTNPRSSTTQYSLAGAKDWRAVKRPVDGSVSCGQNKIPAKIPPVPLISASGALRRCAGISRIGH